LATGRHWKLNHEFQLLGPELWCDLLLRKERLQFVKREGLARFQDDARATALTQPLVRDADQRHVAHLRMAEQHVLDLLDRDVLTAADDDVLASTGNADVSVGIAPRTIPSLQPTVRGKALLREAAALNVADEGKSTAGEQVA